MKKLFTIIIIIVGLALPAVAQVSPYLDKGKSGFGLNVGYEQGHGFKGAVLNLGYSYKGAVDIEFNYYNDAYDKENEGLLLDGAKSQGLMGCVNWWVLRKQPTDAIEVMFGLDAGLEYFTFSGYSYATGAFFPVQPLGGTGGFATEYLNYTDGFAGIDARVKFHMGDGWSLMPGFAVVYDIGSENTKDDAGTYNTTYNGLMSRMGVNLAKKLAKGNVVYFETNHYLDTFNAPGYVEMKVGFALAGK